MERGEEVPNGAILTPPPGCRVPLSVSEHPSTVQQWPRSRRKRVNIILKISTLGSSTKDQQLTFIEHLLCAWPCAKPFPLHYLIWSLIAQGAGRHYYSHFSDEETGVSCG